MMIRIISALAALLLIGCAVRDMRPCDSENARFQVPGVCSGVNAMTGSTLPETRRYTPKEK